EAGDHALGGERVDDLQLGRAHAIDGNVRIEAADPFAEDGHELFGVHGGAHVNGHAVNIVTAEVRDESLLGDFIAKIGVLDVFDHADDFHERGRPRIAAEADVQAYGISAREVFAGEGFVDHHRGGFPVVVLFAPAAKGFFVVVEIEVAAVDDGN